MHWYGYDLDGSLAYDHRGLAWRDNLYEIGPPIPLSLKRVKHLLAEGKEVRIFTARVASIKPKAEIARQKKEITAWLLLHVGQKLAITAEKDENMEVLYDDRVRQLIPNTGVVVE